MAFLRAPILSDLPTATAANLWNVILPAGPPIFTQTFLVVPKGDQLQPSGGGGGGQAGYGL